MKSRKGFLLAEETLKMVIAVIAIGFLVYLLVSVYLKSRESKDLEFAKASLEHLVSEINSGASEGEMYNPNGWHITSWPSNIFSITFRHPIKGEREESLPRYCRNLNWNSCICICHGRKADKCDKGSCSNNENGFVVKGEWGLNDELQREGIKGDKNSIEIKNPPVKLNIDQKNKIITKK